MKTYNLLENDKFAEIINKQSRLIGIDHGKKNIARDFSKSLTEQLSIPVTLWDERLSSEGAYKGMSKLSINVTKKQKKLDENSAAFILQGFIDYYKNQIK